MVQRYPEVNKIAAIILARPAATARDIAQELQYSQPRSVYYWLRKAGYNGLTAFRDAVLTGAYPVTTYSGGPVSLRAARVAEIPMTIPAESTDAEKDYVVTTKEVSPDAFALKVASDAYVPVFERDDVLIIDPDDTVKEGDLVVLRDDREGDIFCRAYPGRKPLYVHPTNGRPIWTTVIDPQHTR